jgi:hypothetical protein
VKTGTRSDGGGVVRGVCGVIAHAAKQRSYAGVPAHAAVRKVILVRQHQHGVEKFRITATIAQQPCEYVELPLAASRIEEGLRSCPKWITHES